MRRSVLAGIGFLIGLVLGALLSYQGIRGQWTDMKARYEQDMERANVAAGGRLLEQEALIVNLKRRIRLIETRKCSVILSGYER